ncbi:MAG: CBS domain-containing protein, partial [Acidimicrobiales bacterium]
LVLMGAGSEWKSAKLVDVLQGMKVSAFMHADQTAVPTTASSAEVAAWLAHFPGRALPVVDELGRYAGIVDYSEVSGASPNVPVGSTADKKAPVLSPDMELFPNVLEAFQGSHRQQLAAVADGRIVGVVYLQAVTAALARAQGSAPVTLRRS